MRMSIAIALEKKLSKEVPERQFQLSDEHIGRSRQPIPQLAGFAYNFPALPCRC